MDDKKTSTKRLKKASAEERDASKRIPRSKATRSEETDWGELRRAMLTRLRKRWPSQGHLHEEAADSAIEALLTNPFPNDHALLVVETKIRDLVRKETRRAALAEGNEDAIAQRSMGGGAGREEVRRYAEHEGPALRRATFDLCKEKFNAAFGFEWRNELARRVLSQDEEYRDYLEAIKVREELQEVVCGVVEFVNRERGSRRAPLGLESFVREHIEPLAGHAYLAKWDSGQAKADLKVSGLYSAGLQRFVYRWDTLNVLNLPPRKDGSSRFLSAEELAVVWLLAEAGWPEVRRWPDGGLTAAEYLGKTTNRMEKALNCDVAPAPGRGARRGPE